MTDNRLGLCFDRSWPASVVPDVARRLEQDGVDDLWFIEDCFYTSSIPLAASALTVTERLRVGLGILPAVARNPALTAMEIATLCALGPGRVTAGIGHGVQAWMAQMGARPLAPVGVLEEVIGAVRRLLAGERVTMSGVHVHLDEVALEAPPTTVPMVLAGVRGPRSLAMAGRVSDGLVLAEATGPAAVRAALATADPRRPFEVVVYAALCVARARDTAYADMAPFLGGMLTEPSAGLRAHPHFDDMVTTYQRGGLAGLAAMPAKWWAEIGLIGTPDDVAEQRAALHAAGATTVVCFPAPEWEVGQEQMVDVATLAATT